MSRLQPYLPRLYRYAFSLTRDEDAAKDLVQQCAVKALAARSVPEDEPAYRAWLFVIFRNAMIDDATRRRFVDELKAPLEENAGAMEFWGGDERLINVLTVKLAMEKLAPHEQEIIGLIDLAGLSYAETAAVLDVPTGTVMSRISRARARLLSLVDDTNVHAIQVRERRGGQEK